MSRLTNKLSRGLGLMGLLMACGMAVQPLRAQLPPPQDPLKGIADPTRPPASVGIKAGTPGTSGAPHAAAGAASGASAPEVVEKPKPVAMSLQAIRFDASTGHAVAMVNDQLVEVGDKVAGMSVISISRHVVVLKGSAGVRRLSVLLDAQETDPPQSMNEKIDTAQRGRKERK